MKHQTKFDRTQTDLVASIHSLRLVVREVGHNYIAGLQSEVARLEESARLARNNDRVNRKQLSQMAVMLKWITNLDVKPQKGRRRDLKELDQLISKLSDMVDTW